MVFLLVSCFATYLANAKLITNKSSKNRAIDIKMHSIFETNNSKLNSSRSSYSLALSATIDGFTIVELLVVIVVIAILAAITVVSYTGISNQAKVAALQSDLSNASTQLKVFQATDPNGDYPTANNCPTPGATEICLKASNNNNYTYASNNATTPKIFRLRATDNTTTYQITNDSSPTTVIALDPANWLTIGTQTWAKVNLNVGTMVTGATSQTNNGGTNIVEKYCYNDLESNCTTYGALYQWDEAMQYTTTNGAQGICPAGSHIPTDNEWKILEIQLGMTQAQADVTGWRGTNQGTQLKSGGTSGLSMPLAGFRSTGGPFDYLSSGAILWSSSESSTSAWGRDLDSGAATVFRYANGKAYGLSVRCLGN